MGLDTTLVNICSNQHPPFSNAGPDLMVTEGDTVTIGDTDTASNDTGPCTYHWHQIEGPQVVLSSVTAPTVTFVAPRQGGRTRANLFFNSSQPVPIILKAFPRPLFS